MSTAPCSERRWRRAERARGRYRLRREEPSAACAAAGTYDQPLAIDVHEYVVVRRGSAALSMRCEGERRPPDSTVWEPNGRRPPRRKARPTSGQRRLARVLRGGPATSRVHVLLRDERTTVTETAHPNPNRESCQDLNRIRHRCAHQHQLPGGVVSTTCRRGSSASAGSVRRRTWYAHVEQPEERSHGCAVREWGSAARWSLPRSGSRYDRTRR